MPKHESEAKVDPYAPVGPPAIETLLTTAERVARHEKEAK